MPYFAMNGATPISPPAAGATTQSAAPLPIWGVSRLDSSNLASAGTYTITHVDPNGGTIAANWLVPVGRSKNADRWFIITANVHDAQDVNDLPNLRTF